MFWLSAKATCELAKSSLQVAFFNSAGKLLNVIVF